MSTIDDISGLKINIPLNYADFNLLVDHPHVLDINIK